MVVTIKIIRKLLEKDSYRNEQHVRGCLVTRVLDKLGWDVWNPDAFYTELKVEKLTSPHDGKVYKGRVDIALRKRVNKEYKSQIFIETKAVGKLKPNIDNHRRQLEAYSLKYNVPMSVLTDGRYWEFYLNSLTPDNGDYTGRMISSLDLVEDKLDRLVDILKGLLDSTRTKAALQVFGKNLHKEFTVLKYIREMKPQAQKTCNDDSLLAHEVLSLIRQKNGNKSVSDKEFPHYWKLFNDNEVGSTKKPKRKNKSKDTKLNPDPPVPEVINLHLSIKGLNASCIYKPKDKVFMLVKKSDIALEHSNSFSGGILDRRNALIDSKVLLLDKSKTKYILQKDQEFKSASAASSFVTGSSSDGFIDWLDNDNLPFDSYRERLNLKKITRKRKS